MRHLELHGGAWVGSNAFRLMPTDPPQDAPLRATVSAAAKGELTQLAYTWTHPADGAQDGLLVLGPGTEPHEVAAFWGDSWHQSPQPRGLEGTLTDGVVTVSYDYGGGWRWQILVDATDPARLTVTMNNVIPASVATDDIAAGPYAAMRAVLERER